MSDPKRRRMFEPTSRFDRAFYALLALTGPTTVLACLGNPDLEFASFIMAFWTLISIFYTIEWALLSYRASRSRPMQSQMSDLELKKYTRERDCTCGMKTFIRGLHKVGCPVRG